MFSITFTSRRREHSRLEVNRLSPSGDQILNSLEIHILPIHKTVSTCYGYLRPLAGSSTSRILW